jgi:hypothetical protein
MDTLQCTEMQNDKNKCTSYRQAVEGSCFKKPLTRVPIVCKAVRRTHAEAANVEATEGSASATAAECSRSSCNHANGKFAQSPYIFFHVIKKLTFKNVAYFSQPYYTAFCLRSHINRNSCCSSITISRAPRAVVARDCVRGSSLCKQ